LQHIAYICIYIRDSVCVCVCIYTCISTHVCTHAYIYTRTHTRVYIYTHTHTHTKKYTHTRIHAYSNREEMFFIGFPNGRLIRDLLHIYILYSHTVFERMSSGMSASTLYNSAIIYTKFMFNACKTIL